MKRQCILVLLPLLLLSFKNPFKQPTDAIEKVFESTFPTAKQVQWSFNGSLYCATFYEQGIQVTISYDEKGQVIKCIRYYLADTLPPQIKAAIMKKFETGKIIGVTEYFDNNETSYHINMKDGPYLYNLKYNSTGILQKRDRYIDASSR